MAVKVKTLTDGTQILTEQDAPNDPHTQIVKLSDDSEVTISDGSGPLTVDGTVTITDNSGPLTVDGTVAVSNLNEVSVSVSALQTAPFTGIGDGRTTVASAGTRVALSTSTVVKEVTITAETDNTGTIVVGGTSCIAALSTRRGTPLDAGDSITFSISNLNLVYLDATVNGDGVTYSYLT